MLTTQELKDFWETQRPIGRQNGKTIWRSIANLINKADKYKLHDLRKDPNDLPEPFKIVHMVICSNNDIHYPEGFYYGPEYNKWSTNHIVIGWRYIEPFESEEEKNNA